MLIALGLYVFFGCIVGIMAGLLGVGGGVILVPILNLLLPMQGVGGEFVHHIALATSMASIMFTSVASTRAHNQRGTILWDVVKFMTPGILLGTFSGTFFVATIPTRPLKVIFAAFLVYTAIQMILNVKPKASFHLPGRLGLGGAGLVIGLLSSFVGIGGGALTIPFLVMCNVPMINVIGISAALGFPIAVAGTLGFVVNGLNVANLPEFSLGYVYLPALIGLVGASMMTVKVGVKLSHNLPVTTLKRFFGFFLAAMASRMIYTLL